MSAMHAMEIVESDNFGQVPELDAKQRQAAPELAKIVDTQKEMRAMLQLVQNDTGHKSNVIMSGAPKNMAACIDTRTRKIYITYEMLLPENRTFALYAARHEAEHHHNRFFHLDLKEHLSTDHIQSLERSLRVEQLPDIDLVEGFNDLLTISKHGQNPNSGYLEKEVPVAMKLENLAKKELGVSLKNIFHDGDQELFFSTLTRLAQRLLFKQEIQRTLFSRRRELEKARLKPIAVGKELLEQVGTITLSMETAEKVSWVIGKLLDQTLQIEALQEFLQSEPANDAGATLLARRI